MKYLYFTRHGESLINISDTWATALGTVNDLGLTEKGISDAKESARLALKDGLKPDLIIASPLKRTQETAAIYADILGYPQDKIELDESLIEIQVAGLEGTSYKAFTQSYSYVDLDKFEGAETIDKLQQRAESVLESLKSRPEETILVVSHSCFGRAFRRVIEGRPFTDEFSPNTKPLPYGQALLVYTDPDS